MDVWVVNGSCGLYDEQRQWLVGVYDSEQAANIAAQADQEKRQPEWRGWDFEYLIEKCAMNRQP